MLKDENINGIYNIDTNKKLNKGKLILTIFLIIIFILLLIIAKNIIEIMNYKLQH